ncbi:faciogenital dysplasia protein [Anaeramoeba flamelloides]|uniref:Faciogenital dysplasia protein n=1 Tax=Anaeramoeba flamelloides TaxID=1746091 RepID=A0AAV7ZBM3_9EUKA|nr:faciogenital dysplasia protein [Anaeramoeba flamelloides]
MTEEEAFDPDEFLKKLLKESEKTNTSFIEQIQSEKNVFGTRTVSRPATKKYDYLYDNKPKNQTTTSNNNNNNNNSTQTPMRKGSSERKSPTTVTNSIKTPKKVGTWRRQERKQIKRYSRLSEKKPNTTTQKPIETNKTPKHVETNNSTKQNTTNNSTTTQPTNITTKTITTKNTKLEFPETIKTDTNNTTTNTALTFPKPTPQTTSSKSTTDLINRLRLKNEKMRKKNEENKTLKLTTINNSNNTQTQELTKPKTITTIDTKLEFPETRKTDTNKTTTNTSITFPKPTIQTASSKSTTDLINRLRLKNEKMRKKNEENKTLKLTTINNSNNTKPITTQLTTTNTTTTFPEPIKPNTHKSTTTTVNNLPITFKNNNNNSPNTQNQVYLSNTKILNNKKIPNKEPNNKNNFSIIETETEPKGSNLSTPPIKRINQNKQIGSFNSLSSPQRFLTSKTQINKGVNNRLQSLKNEYKRNNNKENTNTSIEKNNYQNISNENENENENINENENEKQKEKKKEKEKEKENKNDNPYTYILADPEKIYKTIETFLEEQNQFTKYYLEPLKECNLITDNEFIPLFSKIFQYINNQNKILEKLKNVIELINVSKKQNKTQPNIYTSTLYCKIFECFSTIRISLFEFSLVSFEENVTKIYNLMKNNSKLKELFEESSKQLSVSGFNYYYLKPLKLVCEYGKYFSELKQYFTKVNSSLYLTKITRISQGFSNLTKTIEPKMITYEHLNDLSILTIQLLKDQQFKLNENNRTLLFVDQVIPQGKKKAYKIFLFTDLLLYALIAKKNQLVPQKLMFLKNVTVKDENDNRKLNKVNAISIFLLNDETRYCFLFQSRENKSNFFHVLRKYKDISKVKIENLSSIKNTIMLKRTHSKKYIKSNNDQQGNEPSVPFAEETKLKKRKLVIIELVKTEEDYVNDLRTIIKHYLDPITENKIVKEKDIPLIFSHTKIIETVNTMLLANLHKEYPRDEDKIAYMNVGTIFIQIAEFFKVYSQYCSNHVNAVNTVVKYSQNQSFQQFCENNKLKIPQVRNLELLDFLIKPIQRICKYPLLFRELLKSTSKDFPDYNDLKEAFLKISEVADYVNEKKRNAEEQMEVVKIHQQISGIEKKFELVKPHRRFIMEGLLKKRSKRRIQQRQFWLFNDLLLYAKPTFAKGKFQYKGNIALNGALLRNFNDKKKKEFKFQIVPYRSKKDYKIYCHNDEEKNIWFNKINEIIQGFQQNNYDTQND